MHIMLMMSHPFLPLFLPLLFSAATVQMGVVALHYDCFAFSDNWPLANCPNGLQWFASVQLCCTSSDSKFRQFSTDADGIFYQQRYLSVPSDFGPNDSVPKGCIRAMHFPSESLPFCEPLAVPSSSSADADQPNRSEKSGEFSTIVTIPVKDSVAQNIFCCSSAGGEALTNAKIKFQNVYHGTIAANFALNANGQKHISIRAACNENAIDVGNNRFDTYDVKCAESDAFNLNRQCCTPKSDSYLTTDNEFYAELKIRTSYDQDDKIEHVNVSVGHFEYDFTAFGPRRRIFNYLKERKIENSAKKAQPFKEPIFYNTEKADKLFWEMSQRNFFQRTPDNEIYGWFNGYDKYGHNCVDFVYEFVCNLFDGNCPPKEIWPNNFVEIDQKLNDSYAFKHKTIKLYGEYNGCSLRKHEFRIEYALDKFVDGVSPPVVISYETGEAEHESGNPFQSIESIGDVMLVQKIRNQQKCYVESIKSDGTVLCKALLDVCSNKYVSGLTVLDSTLMHNLKSRFEEEIDGIVYLNWIKSVVQLQRNV